MVRLHLRSQRGLGRRFYGRAGASGRPSVRTGFCPAEFSDFQEIRNRNHVWRRGAVRLQQRWAIGRLLRERRPLGRSGEVSATVLAEGSGLLEPAVSPK